MTKFFKNSPAPKREVRPSGGWFGKNWIQYEGQHEGATICVTYVMPKAPDDPDKPDLSDCVAFIHRWDGVL